MTIDVERVPGPPAARQSQKAATRQRVLAAARELFDTHGYQGTTIREIARHAGVAVGSVFTTFASKGEILSEVMQARIDPLYAELDRVMPHLHGATADRLRTMFAIHLEFEARNVRLFLSHIAAAYDWTLSPGARPYGHNTRLMGAVIECLERGKALGDIRQDVDCHEVVDLIMAAYAWTYRLVITHDADAQAMIAAMNRQIGLIVEGLAPRP
ncbi:TetR/AcrR family transcriptional regulator [Phenylobacterium sp.]|uniref:TetR/AcrR family transcriptional regulator n=1 Tax=Phenylobacterium sp. TaxID=1871053 RepID=UPI0025D81CBD|nr:TetR/AcrR family transcriptional regulator [Phenylobacterium sp.]